MESESGSMDFDPNVFQLSLLPIELQIKIFSFLNVEQLLKVKTTSWTIKWISESNEIWKEICVKAFNLDRFFRSLPNPTESFTLPSSWFHFYRNKALEVDFVAEGTLKGENNSGNSFSISCTEAMPLWSDSNEALCLTLSPESGQTTESHQKYTSMQLNSGFGIGSVHKLHLKFKMGRPYRHLETCLCTVAVVNRLPKVVAGSGEISLSNNNGTSYSLFCGYLWVNGKRISSCIRRPNDEDPFDPKEAKPPPKNWNLKEESVQNDDTISAKIELISTTKMARVSFHHNSVKMAEVYLDYNPPYYFVVSLYKGASFTILPP